MVGEDAVQTKGKNEMGAHFLFLLRSSFLVR